MEGKIGKEDEKTNCCGLVVTTHVSTTQPLRVLIYLRRKCCLCNKKEGEKRREKR